ncbi:MAG: triose-phosphate isomerase [Candidatus Nealsonbacteria bacterium]|nr:triose-phosphate isomerase [Candidatus Nealsonbacteria bacterium]
MKYLIVANWKCNPVTLKEAESIFQKTEKGIKDVKNVETIICPPFIYLSKIVSEKSGIKIGGQDCYSQEKGAFTGEMSPNMLKEIGCQYVIIGHSERRKYQKETDKMINEKIKAALKAGLRPILCIDNIDQIKKDTDGLSQSDINSLAIAYEPIWAIGTGKACGISEAKEMNLAIKEISGKSASILYGGSVSSQNAQEYIKEAGFNGLLVGGASLKPEEFIEIIKIVDSI